MLIPALVGCALVAAVLYTIGRYFVDPRGLRRYPSPSFAAFSPFWAMYHNWRGQQFKVIRAVHEKHGPVVRISPNHVSFSSPTAYKDIYGFNVPIKKDAMYDHLSGGSPSMSTTTDKRIHAGKRKNLSHIFSAKEITAMEARVQVVTSDLCKALRIKSTGGKVSVEDKREVTEDGIFDIRHWLNLFTYDAITAMVFTNSYGFLQRGVDLCPSLSPFGQSKTVNAMDSFHSAGAFNTFWGHLPTVWNDFAKWLLGNSHGAVAGSNFVGMSRFQVDKRLVNEPTNPDLFSRLPIVASEKRPQPMPVDEVVTECATLMDAGNDTTQTTLSNCMYQLAKDKRVQSKLRDILRKEVPKGSQPVASYEELKHISYLRAVLDENFRYFPPLARGLPRRTLEDTIIAGEAIAKGTTVSASIYTLHHNADLFPSPNNFIPERWLLADDPCKGDYPFSEQELKNLKDFAIPFSIGPRACIGRNLAYMEISIVIASLVMAFEWELGYPDRELEHIERFNCNVKELFVKATPLQV